MDTLITFVIAAAICVVFLLNYVMKLKARERRAEEAAKKGTIYSHGPRAQHPHIDANACIGCATCTTVCPEGDVLAMLGGKAVDMLLEGQNNAVAILQWSLRRGFYVDSFDGNAFRDRWGFIHARELHPSFYDPQLMRPSRVGIDYLLPIFTNAIGQDDVEYVRASLFDAGSLTQPYHSVNTDISKRIRYLQSLPADHRPFVNE